jgi:hypothetical protein
MLEAASDRLPIVRPTEGRVRAMLDGRDPTAVVARVPPLGREAFAGDVARLAVAAGCRPGDLPVLLACLRALEAPELNAFGVLTTTGSATFAVIVRGVPGFHAGANALGPGAVANAVVGRALGFLTRGLGGASPGVGDMATMGQPGKYAFCFGEGEGPTRWPVGPRGVTLVGVAGTVEVVNAEAQLPTDVLHGVAATLAAPSALRLDEEVLVGGGQPLVLLPPEIAGSLAAAGLTREDVQRELHRRAVCPLDRLPDSLAAAVRHRRRERLAPLGAPIPVAACPEDILVVVTGGPGIKATVCPSWNGGTRAAFVPVEAVADPLTP